MTHMSGERKSPRRMRPAALFGGVLAAALVAGCGKGDDPDRKVGITGRVTLAGVPLIRGEIVFIPDEERGSKRIDCPMGNIAPDGTYTVELRGEGGAAMGSYKVMVMATRNPVEIRPDWVPVWIVHPKYTQRHTTDLRVEVVENPAPGAYDFDLSPP